VKVFAACFKDSLKCVAVSFVAKQTRDAQRDPNGRTRITMTAELGAVPTFVVGLKPESGLDKGNVS
jgi:hypothetical protein